jgi:hypothetical protein
MKRSAAMATLAEATTSGSCTKAKAAKTECGEEYIAAAQTQWQSIAERTAQTLSRLVEQIQAAVQSLSEGVQQSLEADTAEVQTALQQVVVASARLSQLGEQTKKIRTSICALSKVSEKAMMAATTTATTTVAPLAVDPVPMVESSSPKN